MGFFSWLTADTGRSICNRFSEYYTFTVYMHALFPDGSRAVYVENSYKGQGDIGKKDYFVLLSEMNPLDKGEPILVDENAHRHRGIEIERGNCLRSTGQWKYPVLTESSDAPPAQSFFKQCLSCPAQGYFYVPQEIQWYEFLGRRKTKKRRRS